MLNKISRVDASKKLATIIADGTVKSPPSAFCGAYKGLNVLNVRLGRPSLARLESGTFYGAIRSIGYMSVAKSSRSFERLCAGSS
jgi:hypothetical protein